MPLSVTIRIFLIVLAGTIPARAATNNSLLDISQDGTLLACTNRDSGTVTIVELPEHKLRAEVPVGKHPEGVSFVGASHTLAVAVYAEDQLVIVDADAGEVQSSIDVFDEPYGVISDPEGKRIYVTLDYPGQVLEIDPATSEVIRTFDAGDFARGIALTAKGDRLLVSQYYTGAILAIDVTSGELVDEWPGISNDNLARQLAVHPNRPKAYVPHIRSRITAAHGEGSIFPYVSVIDTDPGEGKRRRRIPMDAFQGNLVTSNPWDAAISDDGRHFYIVFASTDDMFACTVVDDDYRELEPRGRMELGRNPRAVRISSDGQTLYVYQALDFNIAVIDAETLRQITTIPVTQNPLDEQVLRGKILFYSAKQPMVGKRWISCSSCHPDGDPDGRTWHNPEGLRNTQSLAGIAWTHPIHWSADRDEVQDFEHTIRGPLMQGRGLLEGTLEKELGTRITGRSAALDALASYVNTHAFPFSPHAKRGLSGAALRGKEIFYSAEAKCAECHRGPLYTDSTLQQPRMHDVGTGEGADERIGPTYDTPSLLGVYRTAPYLHHGAAATLMDVLTTANERDQHGVTSHLQPAQLEDLVEFLKSLPYEEPIASAERAGLTKVENKAQK